MKIKGVFVLLFIFLFSEITVSATISNVSIEPLHPNLNSRWMLFYADIINENGTNYTDLYYKIEGDPAIQTIGISHFSNGIAGILYKPGDNITISYQIISVDTLGNSESTEWYGLTYDGSAPITRDDAPESTNHAVTVTLTCTDTISGCNQTYYSINDSDFIPYAPFALTGAGEYQLRYYSTDNAGNNESIETGTLVKIDITPDSPSPSNGGSPSSSNSGGGDSVKTVNYTISNDSTAETLNSEDKLQNSPKTGITGRSVVELVGGGKGISIIVGILIIAGMSTYLLIKKRIKRKLWGKY